MAVAVLWWSLTSPSLQVQVPMVLTVQMAIEVPQLQLIYNVADVLVMHIVQVPQVQVVFLTCFPQFLVQARSCPAVHHRVHYLVQGDLRAAQGLQAFRLAVPMLSHANGLLVEIIPVVFDYREHVLRCGGLLLGRGQQGLRDHGVVGDVQAGVLVVLVCDRHVHALHRLLRVVAQGKGVRGETPGGA